MFKNSAAECKEFNVCPKKDKDFKIFVQREEKDREIFSAKAVSHNL